MQWRLENKTLIVIICLKFVYRVFYFFNLRSGGYKGRGGDVFFHFLNCCEIYVCPHYQTKTHDGALNLIFNPIQTGHFMAYYDLRVP